MRILIDDREKLPYDFSGFEGIEIVKGRLNVGDYSVYGLQNEVAVERKSLNDLANCLGSQRTRFMDEMMRSRGLRRFCIVVESDWKDLMNGNYYSKVSSASAVGSVTWLQSRGIQFHFAGDRQDAEKFTYDYLRHYVNAEGKRADSILSALNNSCGGCNGN